MKKKKDFKRKGFIFTMSNKHAWNDSLHLAPCNCYQDLNAIYCCSILIAEGRKHLIFWVSDLQRQKGSDGNMILENSVSKALEKLTDFSPSYIMWAILRRVAMAPQLSLLDLSINLFFSKSFDLLFHWFFDWLYFVIENKEREPYGDGGSWNTS